MSWTSAATSTGVAAQSVPAGSSSASSGWSSSSDVVPRLGRGLPGCTTFLLDRAPAATACFAARTCSSHSRDRDARVMSMLQESGPKAGVTSLSLTTGPAEIQVAGAAHAADRCRAHVSA